MPTESALYKRLHHLSLTHAIPPSLDDILSIRHPSATHAWGHAYLVSKNPGLGDIMDNEAFKSHLHSSGRYLTYSEEKPAKVHSIIIDEYARKSVIHMSYFLVAKGKEEEVVEQDLIWTLTFTEGEDVEGVLIKESIEYIDASASARVGTLVRSVHGEIESDVRGGITLKEA